MVTKQKAFPSCISILGQSFRVELVPDLKDDDGDSLFGDTGSDILGGYHRIRINAGLDTQARWRVLIHEHVHGVLKVNGASAGLDGGIEEVIANSLEYSIQQLIMQFGPELVAQFYQKD